MKPVLELARTAAMALVIMLAACGREASSPVPAEENAVALGPQFSAKKGLLVPEDTRRSLGLKIVEVTERKISTTVEVPLRVYRSDDKNCLASGTVALQQAQRLKPGQSLQVRIEDATEALGKIIAVNDTLSKASGLVEVLVEIRKGLSEADNHVPRDQSPPSPSPQPAPLRRGSTISSAGQELAGPVDPERHGQFPLPGERVRVRGKVPASDRSGIHTPTAPASQQPLTILVGAFLRAFATVDSAEAVTAIPRAALVQCSDGYSVYTVNGEHLIRAAVKVGAADAEFVEIKEGLYAGDQVVEHPVLSLWLTELAAVKGGQACCVMPPKGK